MTTATELVDEARQATGLDDLGSDHVWPLLEAVARDLDGDALNDRGRAIVRGQVVRTMQRRLRLVETWRRHPEIDDVELPPIVAISGLPRTGTTLLHNVFDQHACVRTFQSWELKEPLPPPEAATYDADPRIAETDARIAPFRGTPIESFHWVEPTEPDEHVWAMTDCNGLLGGGPTWALPELRAALDASSAVPTFTEVRRTFQLLLWRNPVPVGHVLVIKDPLTTGRLPDFVEVFGDAQVVAVHRDPYRILRSNLVGGAALTTHLRRDPQPNDPLVDMRPMIAGLVAGLDAAGDRAHSLAYPDVVADPVAAAAPVLDAVGLDGRAPEFAEAVTAYLAWQRDGGRPTPIPAYPDLDRSREEVWADPTVAAYVDRFDIQPEERRLTGV